MRMFLNINGVVEEQEESLGSSESEGVHRELYSVLCGDLNGKEIQKRGDVCICLADSLCCAAEHCKTTVCALSRFSRI